MSKPIREEDILLARARTYLYPNPAPGGLAELLTQLVRSFEQNRTRLEAAEAVCEIAAYFEPDPQTIHKERREVALTEALESWRNRKRSKGGPV